MTKPGQYEVLWRAGREEGDLQRKNDADQKKTKKPQGTGVKQQRWEAA